MKLKLSYLAKYSPRMEYVEQQKTDISCAHLGNDTFNTAFSRQISTEAVKDVIEYYINKNEPFA